MVYHAVQGGGDVVDCGTEGESDTADYKTGHCTDGGGGVASHGA